MKSTPSFRIMPNPMKGMLSCIFSLEHTVLLRLPVRICPISKEKTFDSHTRRVLSKKIDRIAVYSSMIQKAIDKPILLGTCAGELQVALINRMKNRRVLHTLVTDLVPSEMACFDNSPGRIRRTAVWISREEMVDFLEYAANSVPFVRGCQVTSA